MKDTELPPRYRKDFPSLERRRNGKPPIYLDNACTTLVPRKVIDALEEYYTQYPACGGKRSSHWFAEEVTRHMEGDPGKGVQGTRQTIADFINADSEKEIIFTLNATHAINTVAQGFNFNPGDTVLLTDREHNSNLLPWLRLQEQGRVKVERFTADQGSGFDLEAFESHLKNSPVRLVSMVYTSNATGVTLPARETIEIAHRYGARVLLDGAQTVPHRTVDVSDLDVDFLAFSLHKMCGPRGIGVLYAKRELLSGSSAEESDPDYLRPSILGGGTVHTATYGSYSLLDAPERFEAGIQNYGGLIASGVAVCYLREIGMERIAEHEHRLNRHLTEALLDRYGDTGWFRIVGPKDPKERGGILTFEVQRPNIVGIAKELNARSNIMLRDGVFCVHSYFNEIFGPNWMHPKSHSEHRMVYRVSLYLYNTVEECDIFAETLDDIFRERGYV